MIVGYVERSRDISGFSAPEMVRDSSTSLGMTEGLSI